MDGPVLTRSLTGAAVEPSPRLPTRRFRQALSVVPAMADDIDIAELLEPVETDVYTEFDSTIEDVDETDPRATTVATELESNDLTTEVATKPESVDLTMTATPSVEPVEPVERMVAETPAAVRQPAPERATRPVERTINPSPQAAMPQPRTESTSDVPPVRPVFPEPSSTVPEPNLVDSISTTQ